MQQITCPNCGEPVSAENINIQEMVAVCKACDTIFKFDAPNSETAKAKRRKVKKPQHLTLAENPDTLQLTFRTNFQLGRDEGFISGAAVSAMFTMLVILVGGEALSSSGDVPILIPFIFGAIASGAFYRLLLRIYNHTHIAMDNEYIRISRKPLPNFLAPTIEVNLSNIVAIRTEETEISVKEAYDVPRYRVWAETTDGSKRTIINDVTEDYAYFITQQLDARLHMEDNALDVSRLEDYEQDTDEDVLNHHIMHTHEETDRR